MARILLDSSVVIDVLRGHPGAVERLRDLHVRGDQPFVCAVTAEEVTVGLMPRERETATRFFEGCSVAPMGVAEGRLAGWWRRRYRSRGRTLSQSDCLIAASAAAIGGRLATGNQKDFPMKELEIDRWPTS